MTRRGGVFDALRRAARGAVPPLLFAPALCAAAACAWFWRFCGRRGPLVMRSAIR
jgi:hypothetical protein